MLGGLFVGTTLLMPRGIIGTIKWGFDNRAARKSAALEDGGDSAIRSPGAAPHAAE
jgi:hypothetical protein